MIADGGLVYLMTHKVDVEYLGDTIIVCDICQMYASLCDTYMVKLLVNDDIRDVKVILHFY